MGFAPLLDPLDIILGPEVTAIGWFAQPGGGVLSCRRLDDNSELFRLPAEGGEVTYIGDISPDGRWAGLKHGDGWLRIWDLEHALVAFQYNNPAASAFSPDSARMALLLEDNRLVIRELAGAGAEAIFRVPDTAPSLRWDPDGKTLACIGQEEVYLLEAASGRVLSHLPSTSQPLNVAWHPDGVRLAASCGDKLIRLWNTATAEEPSPLLGHLGTVTCLSFSPDGTLLASDGWDGRLRLWDLEAGKEIMSTHAGPEGVQFSADGRHLAVYSHSQSRVDLFDLAANEGVIDLTEGRLSMRAVNGDALLFSPSGDWLATSAGEALTFWKPDSGRPLGRVEKVSFTSLQLFNSTGGIFGLTTNRFYRLTARQTGGRLQAGPPEPFHLDVPAALKGQLSPAFLTEFSPDRPPGRTAASGDGHLIAVIFQDRCYVLDMSLGALQAITGQQTWMRYVAVSPDGRWIATGGWHNPNVKVWSASTGLEEKELPTAISPAVTFSPDGQWLVSGTGREYQFWHAGDWTAARSIGRPGDDDLPGPMAFSPDGKLLALAHTRGIVHLVCPANGQLLARIEPVPDNEIVRLAFNSDASELALTRIDAPPQIWHLRRIRQQLGALGLDW